RPDSERHIDLLGLAHLSTRSKSDDRQLRLLRGRRHLDLCSHTLAAPLRGPAELDLQPRQSGPLYACLRFAFSLALRVLIDAERTGVSCGALPRRRMALTAAPVQRRSWRSADGAILPEPTVHHTGSAPSNPSQLPDKIQTSPAARLFHRSTCRILFCCHWMGNSQTGTTLLARCYLRRI